MGAKIWFCPNKTNGKFKIYQLLNFVKPGPYRIFKATFKSTPIQLNLKTLPHFFDFLFRGLNTLKLTQNPVQIVRVKYAENRLSIRAILRLPAGK